jgi:hypothetical protein
MYKRVLCLTILCGLGCASVAAAGDLVGHWKLDEETGTVAADSSGNGNDGTWEGNPTVVDGPLGKALAFNNSRVIIPASDTLTAGLFQQPFTLTAWINPTRVGNTWQQIFRAIKTDGNSDDTLFLNNDGRLSWRARVATVWTVLCETAPGVVPANDWTHIAVVGDGTNFRIYVKGAVSQTAAFQKTDGTNATYYIAGNTGGTTESYAGMVDDFRIYSRALTAAEIQQIGFWPNARKPNPADKAVAVSQALFQWTPGDGAVFSNVYLGKTPELTAADLVGPNLPFTMYFHVAGIEPGATYYWRVDEIDAAGVVTTGNVWSFTATPATAWAQNPADGATYLPDTATLSWSAGLGAVTHDVYLSQDRAAVEAGAAGAKVAPSSPTTTFKAANLERGKDYFWRVDEQLATGSIVTGPVWSFTVRPIMTKADPDLLAWWKLDEAKSPFAADYSGNDYYGTLTGSPQWVEGFLDSGLQFNGTSDYVDFGTPAALYQPKAYTYSTWFKVAKDIAGNSGAQYLLCLGSRSDLVFGVEDGVSVNGDLCLHYYDTAPGFHAVQVGQTVWRADEWHMVTATKDAAGHKIYLDGELKNSDTNTRDDNYATTRMISIGARGWTNPKIAFFNGTLDDVRIYSRALAADEIKQIMRGDPLLAWGPQPPSSATVDFREVADLTWSAGDTAAKHDVYLGQDKDAVKAADTTSPLYQGRQAGTSFSVAGLVEFGGGSYYWRIDEVEADGTTIHKGAVWSFTVPAYLIVDQFETYTDVDGERIYQTWIDGWTNGTGSVVGNLAAPFAEQTIVHSGRQSMPMDYNNIKSPYYSEAELDFAPLQDWTAGDVNTLSLWFRGRPATPAVVETAPGQYKIGACSNDIWGTADSFNFYYKTLTGDGSISAQVLAVTNTTSVWAKAGVMIRESLDPASTYANMFPTPDGRRAFQNRPVAGGNAFSAHSATGAVTIPFWVKVERKGSTITGYYSTDGKTWTRQPDTENTGTDKSLNPQTIAMGSTIYVGLCVASNNFGAATCFGEFSEVTTTGSVSGSWKLAKIGTSYSNDPDQLYVAVEDSAGKSALVTHPDPAAVGLTTWTEWKIPLTDLTGVNLAKVKKFYLGVGDKKTPVGGATGRMYFDDIRVTK